MTGQVNRGIYDDFHGYRLPTEDELNSALHSALVVLDTNVLLNLYRYNELTRNDLLGVLRGLGKRLWVPHQVMREFWRNRVSVLVSRGAGTEQALAALTKQQRDGGCPLRVGEDDGDRDVRARRPDREDNHFISRA